MKKLIFLITILSALCFSSCSSSIPPVNSPQFENPPVEIVTPPFSDIGRDKILFSEIEYSRPDTDELIKEIEDLQRSVIAKAFDYDELIDQINSVDKKYSNFDTMCALLTLNTSENISDETLSYEYEYLTGKAPNISRALEELFVALANSDFAEKLESDFFGEGFIEKYKDGSKYNDHTVSLLEQEASLEAEYFSLSPATVTIVYEGKKDSYEDTLARIEKKYKSNPIKYRRALAECEKLFYLEFDKKSSKIYTELLKTRYLIAKSYGYYSYQDYAYETLGHDYSKEKTDELLKDISEYAVPIYTALNSHVFAGYFKTHKAPSVNSAKVINDLYTAISSLDEDIASVYSYMLNCGLYNISTYSLNRRNGAFTIHLRDYDVPFVFATVNGDTTDYMTIAHEFGHFYDNIKNSGVIDSLDLCEVTSQSLELLTLSKLRDILSEEEYKHLYYSQMRSILETLIYQGFYAKFEALAYQLPYEDITEENLNKLVVEAATAMKLNTEYINSLSDVIIIHLIDTPFYVQSYCTSLTASLDIYFTECQSEGRGIAAYKAIVQRNDEVGFETVLENSGVPSPFRKNAIQTLTDKIYFSIIGSHYYEESKDADNAA